MNAVAQDDLVQVLAALRRAEQESRLLRTIAQALGETEELSAALEVVLRGVCETAGWVVGQAWLVSSDGTTLTCCPAWYSGAAGLEPFRAASQELHFAPGEGLPGRAWATRQPAWSRDITLDRLLPRGPIGRDLGLKAGMAIPVLAGSQVVGVLEFFEFDQHEEDERLVTLVSAVAAHVGQLIRRKQAEEALRLSEARYRAVVDTAVDAIITMSADGMVRSFNRGAEQLFDYRAEEVLGHPLTVLMPEEVRPRHTAGVQHYLQTREARVLGRVLSVAGRRKDGREVAVELIVTAIPEQAGPLFAAILRDCTARQQMDADRAALLAVEREHFRHLQDLAALRADLTTLVAHELGSPLAAMRSLVDMLAVGQSGADEQARTLATLRSELRLLTALVADVQAAASLEQDAFTVQIRPVPLADLLSEAASSARALPGGHPVLTTGDVGGQVLADPDRISQVLRNLLSNAAKYALAGTPIELRAQRWGKCVRLAVADRGPGIPSGDRGRIFEKFWRGHQQTDVAGLGLGLYLARRLCRAHGTDLTVGAAPGGGAIFAFDLQVAP